MSKKETKRTLIKEINKINRKIEINIALGRSYSKEAQRHAKLFNAIESIA